MDLRSLSEDAPESQWREPLRDKVGAEQLQQVHHCTTQTGGSDGGPEGQRSAPSGSRRAATGVRNNRRVRSETVEDHDRRSLASMAADLAFLTRLHDPQTPRSSLPEGFVQISHGSGHRLCAAKRHNWGHGAPSHESTAAGPANKAWKVRS